MPERPAPTLIPRRRFDELWGDLPQLTVVSAVPGWGRTTWMRQCEAFLRRRDPGVVRRWITSRSRLRDELSTTSASARREVLFVDSVVHAVDDPLWSELVAAARSRPSLRLVVSSLDLPPGGVSDIDTRVLSDGDLAFTDEEIAGLVAPYAARLHVDGRETMLGVLRGGPGLVHRYVLRSLGRVGGVAAWAPAPVAPERVLLERLLSDEASEEIRRTHFVRMVTYARSFRRFSAEFLRPPAGVDADYVRRQFARLGALPLGAWDIDGETGEDDHVWSAQAWSWFGHSMDVGSRIAELRASRDAVAAAGRTVGQLFYLLETEDRSAAETLAASDWRRMQIHADAPTTQRLLTMREGDLPGHPHLALLSAALRIRREGISARSDREARAALEGLARVPVATPLDRLGLACRQSFAAVLAGDRVGARRLLAHIRLLLEENLGVPVDAAALEESRVAQLCGDIAIAFTAAVQVDDHVLALQLARASSVISLPDDPAHRLDEAYWITQEDFAGTRSLALDGADPEDPMLSNALPLTLLETGADDSAVDFVRPFLSLIKGGPPRSAVDAMAVLVDALTQARLFGVADVENLIDASRRFWRDGEAGSFLVFAAVVSFQSAGSWQRGKELAETAADDWFGLTARGLVQLWSGRPTTAAELFVRASRTPLPRLELTSRVLHIAAVVGSATPELGRGLTQTLWRDIPSPRLLRFALRFVPLATRTAMAEWAPGIDPGLERALRAAADDLSPLGAENGTTLTQAEREILGLIAAGLTNEQLAQQRFVTVNTIRSQLRVLYRKLGARSRADAVLLSERRGLLRDDT